MLQHDLMVQCENICGPCCQLLTMPLVAMENNHPVKKSYCNSACLAFLFL